MAHILAQLAPQRSTLYSNIAGILAPIEMTSSPLSQSISSVEKIKLGQQEYLKIAIDDMVVDDNALYELGNLSMTSSFFNYFEKLGSFNGPFLKPIEIPPDYEIPHDLLVTRRYKGKTNEMFTHFLCNIARYSSSYSSCKWPELRIFDPLAGGGTTLFTALYLGAEAAGVEKRSKDIQSTVSFLKQYTKEQGIFCEVKEERIKKSLKRYWFTIGEKRKRLLLVKGETADSPQLTAGFKKFHCIVTDLPYGIQHGGKITDLLTDALPGWSSLLLSGGTIAMSWESSRFPRKEMIGIMEKTESIRVLKGHIYEDMSHRVDRVIKKRDVIVARVD
jgi:hypothetical protein